MKALKGLAHASPNPVWCFCLHCVHEFTVGDFPFEIQLKLFLHPSVMRRNFEHGMPDIFFPRRPRPVLAHYKGITIRKRNGSVHGKMFCLSVVLNRPFHYDLLYTLATPVYIKYNAN